MLSDDRNKLQVLATFLNRTSDSVFITDGKGITLEINKKFEELYGWSRNEIIGQKIPMAPESLLLAQEAVARAAM